MAGYILTRRERFVRRSARLAGCVVLAVAAVTRAHETDQFSVPLGREFADLRFYFSNDIRKIILRGVESTNARIRAAMKRHASEAELARLQSPDVVTRAVWSNFPAVINQIERIDATLHSPATKKRFPGLVVAYRPWIWIYHHPILLLDLTKAVRLGRSSTLMIDGVYFGTDKIAHFAHMGILYYNEYRSAINSGADEAEAVSRAINLGAGSNPFLSENALLGLLSTGVRSNADLAANYVGFKFFRNLTAAETLKGRVQPPLLVRDGAYWRLNDHVRENTDWFTVFVSDHWNEALNPNGYGPGIGAVVCAGIKSRCESILNWYLDESGRSRTREDFIAVAERLSTYYGEGYGHEGAVPEMTGVHTCCFNADQSPLEMTRTPTPVAGDARPNGSRVLRASIADSVSDNAAAPGIWEAIRLDDAARFEELLTSPRIANQIDRDGSTVLHYAVRFRRGGMVRSLIARGADVNARGVYGATPLHLAARESDPVVLAILIEAGARPEVHDEFGCTPLHDAAGRGDVSTVVLLLNAGANANARDDYANTPLHRAARGGHTEVVDLLLRNGAERLSVNQFGNTPLDEAAGSGHRALARSLRRVRHRGEVAQAGP